MSRDARTGRQELNRGDVWWVKQPESKRRPYLILIRPSVLPLLNSLIAVPATSTIRGLSSEVIVDEDDGMPRRCALLLDKITNVPRGDFIDHVTTLRPARLHQVCVALQHAVGCSR